MLSGILTLFFAFAFTMPQMASAQQPSESKLLAVHFYADWCKFCKKLKPSFEELQEDYGDKVEFVILDYTNDETTKATEQLITNRSLTTVVQNYVGTGFILLVAKNTDGTKSVKSILNKKLKLEEMREIMEDYI
jgi:thiol-disulfide isomerase/thioredoxin